MQKRNSGTKTEQCYKNTEQWYKTHCSGFVPVVPLWGKRNSSAKKEQRYRTRNSGTKNTVSFCSVVPYENKPRTYLACFGFNLAPKLASIRRRSETQAEQNKSKKRNKKKQKKKNRETHV